MSSDQGTSPIVNTTAAIEDRATATLALLMQLPGQAEGIEAQELAGQMQLVNSDRLPTESRNPDDEFIALGFTFGAPDPGDPMFRPATLPAGWKREASDHAMHSHLLDELGRQRVNIFYKAAFYDRRADMYLVSPGSYLDGALYHGTEPVLDDTWLSVEIAVAELDRIAEREDEGAGEAERFTRDPAQSASVAFWAETAARHRADAAKARAMRDSLVQQS